MAILALNVVMLIVGAFVDLPAAVLLLGPIFVVIAKAIGLDPVQLGLMMVVNLAIGLYTPPVGTTLFISAAIARVGIGGGPGPRSPSTSRPSSSGAHLLRARADDLLSSTEEKDIVTESSGSGHLLSGRRRRRWDLVIASRMAGELLSSFTLALLPVRISGSAKIITIHKFR